MNNTRFATAIHILTILAASKDEWVSSEWIAGSININSVVVRKELLVLQGVDLVMTRKGKEGGSRLSKPADQIKLSEVYLAIKNSDVLGKKNLNPSTKCPIGNHINSKLNLLFNEVDQHVVDLLEGKTLQRFVEQFV